jgi:hypothetical protein
VNGVKAVSVGALPNGKLIVAIVCVVVMVVTIHGLRKLM